MAELNKVLNGTLKHSVQSFILSWWISEFREKTIPLPATLQSHMFIFEIEERIKRIEGLTDLTDDAIRDAMSLLAGLQGKLDDDRIDAIFIQAGYTDSNKISELKRKASEAFVNEAAKAGLVSLLAQDFFKSDIAIEDMKVFNPLDFSSIVASIRVVQEYWTKLCDGEPVQALAGFLKKNLYSDPGLAHARTLFKLLNEDPGPISTMKLSYVIDTVLHKMYGKPLIEFDMPLPGHVFEVSKVMEFEELSFANCLGALITSIRAFAGFDTDSSHELEITLQDILKQSTYGFGDILPGLPKEAGDPSIADIGALFSKFFSICLVRRSTEQTNSVVTNYFLTRYKEQRYGRQDTLQRELDQSFEIAGLFMSSYLDTVAIFHFLATDTTVHFPEPHPTYQTKIRKVVYDLLGQFKNLRIPMTNRNFLKEPSLAINTSFSTSFINPDFFIADDDFERRKVLNVDFDKGTGVSLFRTQTMSGEMTNVMPGFQYRKWLFAEPFTPRYVIRRPGESLPVDEKLIKARLGFKPLENVQSAIDFYQYIQNYGQIKYISGWSDFARETGLPHDIAREVFEGRTGFYFDFTGSRVEHWIWSPDQADLFEVISVSEDPRIYPVVGRFPLLVSHSVTHGSTQIGTGISSGGEGDGTDPVAGDGGAGVTRKKAQAKKKESKKKEKASSKGKTAEELAAEKAAEFEAKEKARTEANGEEEEEGGE